MTHIDNLPGDLIEVSTLPLGMQVNMGKKAGYSVIDKFGVNPEITVGTDPEDVWEGGGLYSYDTFGTAPIVSIASNNAGDTQEISIDGLDINGAFVNQKITLQGTTRTALTTALWRVFRLENEADAGGDISGTVFCYTGTGAVPSLLDSEVRAVILNGNNQTQMALYTIPKGKVGYLFRGEIGIEYSGSVGAGTNFAKVQYQSRRVGKVFKTKKTINVISAANSNYGDVRSFPDAIPALTDIKVKCLQVSETMGVWATLDMMLIDETELDRDFLDAIGQPR